MDGLAEIVFGAGLVFARVGSFIMVAPGFSDPGPPARVRLAFALLVSMTLAPVLADVIPAMPDNVFALAGLVVVEALIGLAFGAILRLFLSALSVAGGVIGLQTGLSMAQALDPSQGQSGALFSGFLSLTGVALVFALDLHHLFLEGLRGGYVLLEPGRVPMIGDFARLSVDTVAQIFEIGVRIAAPLLVFGLAFYVGLGVLSRMMPQAQVFFAAQPALILLGIAIFAITLGGGLMIWADAVETYAREFI